MCDRPQWERWVLAVDVPANGAVPPVIIVRHILKRLWRSWGVKCKGFSEDRRLFELQEENKKLRSIIDGLAQRVAQQSELLARAAEKREGS